MLGVSSTCKAVQKTNGRVVKQYRRGKTRERGVSNVRKRCKSLRVIRGRSLRLGYGLVAPPPLSLESTM